MPPRMEEGRKEKFPLFSGTHVGYSELLFCLLLLKSLHYLLKSFDIVLTCCNCPFWRLDSNGTKV